MMSRTLCWIFVLLMCVPAFAEDLFAHPKTPAQAETLLRAAMPELGQVQVLRGRYTQRKFLREIPRPLTSTGEFLLVRERGVWWHTQTPLDSELILIGGSKAKSGSSPQQPGLEMAASVFFALFTLDLDTLSRSFDLFLTQSGSRWTLGLRPRDAALGSWFEKATISGSARVEQVTLFEAAGDRTEIDLLAVAQPQTSLTSAERKRFDH